MKRQNKTNTELLWNSALLLLIPIWISIAPEWYKWFSSEGNGLILKNLYAVLDGRWLLNIPLCICVIYGIIRWCRKIWKDNYFRYHRLILIVLSIVILLYAGDNVTYAKIVWLLDFRILILSLLILMLVLMGIKIICKLCKTFKKRKEEKLSTKTKGFSDDNLDKETSKVLQEYASEIIERLLATDLTKHAFAVGITGEWGVGKTTFLDTLKKTIIQKAEVVEFNPWMCRTPEQVINDFFASLRHQLSPKYSKLSRSIQEYAKYVGSLSVKPSSVLPFNFSIPIQQDSLFERKKTLAKKFAELPHPVVVFIDDIDRLASEEVFEVLRLIRNTADLCNTIYLVAYDKDYVTSVLREKNVKDSIAYLEKIFQVEVSLPKVEDQLIWDTLFEEIEKQNSFSAHFTQELFNQFSQDNRKLILRILDNYRRTKRFARLYMLNTSYLMNQYKGEMRLLDIFWLELLQIYDYNVYNILADEPLSLLYYNHEEKKFLLRNGISDSPMQTSQNKYEGDEIWKVDTPKILELLFGEYRKTKPQSICFTENYSKYFTLSVSPFKLSISELKQLFVEGANCDEVVKSWLKGGKYFDSIVFQFKQIPVKQLNEVQLKAFLNGVLAFGLQITPYKYNNRWEMMKLLRQERYAKNTLQTINNIAKLWISEKMTMDNKTILDLSKLLSSFYITETFDMCGDKEVIHPLIISNNEIEELLKGIMENYLERHPDLIATSLLSENGELPYLFNNCCVNVKLDLSAGDEVYKQLAFDIVIEHFSKKEKKPSIQEYEDAYGKLFCLEEPESDVQSNEDDYWDYMSDMYYRNLQEYFGDSFNSKLEEFKTKCFESTNNNETIADKHQ